MFNMGLPEGLILAGIFTVWPFWKIFDRVGLSPWLSLLMVIPVVNIITLFYLAFTEWPSMNNKKRIINSWDIE
ncbi:hypothetical protein H1S01_10795 [Heliobacterium chlorum]|uniref:Uncharacterized protein n=1 Tax=Heliobacterium chlorum TaxID=2698 RepID=A0ABR7T2Y0_HELCL|nr:hypothetical protein [Heliobacterium chlorum]MBC9784996.1 hypothetical protein [Heliobacterium chlorum]